ncbi:SIMPL domain-containing protein [Methylobacterium sp. M6A4_1b]
MRRAGAFALLALALLGAGGAVRAEDRPGPTEGRISVVGRARSEVAPDFASVEIGVEARGATPAVALDGASTAAKAILVLAAEFQVPEADLGTSAVTLQPVTRSVRQSDGTFTEKPDGYRASNTVRVRLADMGRLGDLMRRALDGGANRIDGVSFGLRDPDTAESAMRSAAMKDARAQAERLAEAAGVTLGRVVSIQSPATGSPPPIAFAAPAPMRSKRGGAPVPLVAGTIETAADVAATFAIAP